MGEDPSDDEMRATVYRIAVESGVSDLAAWLMRRRATILTYHGLTATTPEPSRRPLYKLMVTEAAFREQMQLLRARYTVVGLEELAGLLAGGGGERLAAVTFDDGWVTTRTLAAPILAELGIPATVFVATGLIGTSARGLWTQRVRNLLRSPDLADSFCQELKLLPGAERRARLEELERRSGPAPELPEDLGFMSWTQVKELPSFGVSVGAHTVDHEILSGLTEGEVRDQVRGSKAAVEAALGKPCRLFAYPNGQAVDFSEAHARFLREEGFVAAVTQLPGRNAPGADPFTLRRINVGLDHSRDSFLAQLDGLRHLALP